MGENGLEIMFGETVKKNGYWKTPKLDKGHIEQIRENPINSLYVLICF